ncbi:MAG: DUF1997 domain-containing protein [Cyanobacteria bacterium CRU_2_1]|nr:DUF1997 domain-containing protein [Cyanobacteria bacterium RU_5_0]NJR58216.1 DUF1997 domain-containing protein [Cyanobacteria bacterium CRU_2_1]
MHTRFSASQSVELVVPEQPIPIQHYLRQPQRLIRALVDPNRIEQLSPECFRLKMRPLSFMTLSIQPTVDMRVWTESDGTICLQSIACEIRGIEYINQRFSLNLLGKLAPYQLNGVTTLRGRADLQVQVDLPPPLWLTPKSLLETTGNGLLRSVLLTIKQRLMHQLLSDYRSWVATQLEQTNRIPESSSLLSPNSPLA